jgi:hypothetical protein
LEPVSQTKSSRKKRTPGSKANIFKVVVLPIVFSIFCLIVTAILDFRQKNPGGSLFNAAFWGPLVFTLVIIILLVAGIFILMPRYERRQAARMAALKARGVETKSNIVNLKRAVLRGEDMPTTVTYQIVCRYETSVSRLQKRFDVSSLAKYSLGDRVTVLYLPEKPKVALFKNHRQLPAWKNWKPPEKVKFQRLSHKGEAISLGFGVSMMLLLSGLKMAASSFVDETPRYFAFVQEMRACSLWQFIIWSILGYLTIWGWGITRKHDHLIELYKEEIHHRVIYEPKIQTNLVACPHCERHLVPGTTRCPYCQNFINMGKRRMFLSGLGISYAVFGLLFESMAASHPGLDSFIFLFTLLGLAGWFFISGWREHRFWKSLADV